MNSVIFQPGFYYVLPYALGYVAYSWFAYQIFSHFLTLKKGWVYKILSYIYSYLVCSMVIMMGDVVNILGTLAIALTGALLLFREGWLPKLSVGMLLFVLAVSISALGDESSLYFFNVYPYTTLEYYLMMSARILCRLILWAVSWLVLRRNYPSKGLRIPSRIWGLIDVLACMPAATILITFMLHTPYDVNNVRTLDYSVYMMMAFNYIVVLALWYLVSMLNKNECLKEEQRLWEIRKIHYENLEREQLSLRRMRHDIANHLQTLSGLQGVQAKEYLQEWMESPVLRPSKRYSENEVVNTVIASKVPVMEELSIDYEINVSLPETLSMKKMDLCGIFANALDNAAEACKQVEGKKRYLQIKAAYAKGLFLMDVRNSITKMPVMEEGEIKTTKNEAENHGIGLKEIEEICRQYQGVVKVSWDHKEFVLQCSIPMQ